MKQDKYCKYCNNQATRERLDLHGTWVPLCSGIKCLTKEWDAESAPSIKSDVIERAAAVIQARTTWLAAEAIANDLYEAGLLK